LENVKLKIAFVVSSFPTVSETFIVNQIVDLLDKGHQVRIFSFQKNESTVLHQKVLNNNLLEKTTYFEEVYVSKFRRYFPFLKFLITDYKNIAFGKLLKNFNFKKYGYKTVNLYFFYKSWWLLRSGDFDIIHAHFGPNGAYVAGLKSRGFLKRSKLVTSFHGYDLNPSNLAQNKYSYHDLFKEVDLMTVNTKYLESLLRKISLRNKIVILPVGLDTTYFSKKNNSCNKEFRILFVGRLIELKAPHLALEIFKLINSRGYKKATLTIIGDGKMKEELNEIINKNHLTNVRLMGALDQEEILKEMELAKVFLFPGIYDASGRAETQGLVIQEAQAMELPVLVSNAGGMKYGVLDGETGFVVKEADIEAFADKIELLIKDENLRQKMGEKGREFIKANYDSKLLGNQLEELYANL
jgi:colanic acid/amylovoran biosynthesis glycosyltransferase